MVDKDHFFFILWTYKNLQTLYLCGSSATKFILFTASAWTYKAYIFCHLGSFDIIPYRFKPFIYAVCNFITLFFIIFCILLSLRQGGQIVDKDHPNYHRKIFTNCQETKGADAL